MGLGPLVCVECQLYARENDQQDYHLCPRCGNQALEYLWMLTESEQEQVRQNDRFYRFTQGKD